MRFLRTHYARKQALDSLAIAASVSSFVGVFVALIPFGLEQEWIAKTICILGVFIIVFVLRLVFMLTRQRRVIDTTRQISIVAMYGDILKIKPRKGTKPVVVIPVNSSFDYIVEDNLNVENPIVSSNSIHGRWITKLTKGDPNELERLKKEIDHGIEIRKLTPVDTVNKKGNRERYQTGSDIYIEREECTYMLFALTDFDENNHVIEKTVGSYSALVNSFIDATNRCQGRDVYVPIMGTGLSLFGLDHKRAFQIMKDSLIARRDTLKSTVHIVVFMGDKEKLSIFDD